MLSAEARIQTPHASRYLVQLCRHADAMTQMGAHLHRHLGAAPARPEVLHVDYSDSAATLRFNSGQCTVRTDPDALTVRIEAADEDSLGGIQDLITADLERFGLRDQVRIDWLR